MMNNLFLASSTIDSIESKGLDKRWRKINAEDFLLLGSVLEQIYVPE